MRSTLNVTKQSRLGTFPIGVRTFLLIGVMISATAFSAGCGDSVADDQLNNTDADQTGDGGGNLNDGGDDSESDGGGFDTPTAHILAPVTVSVGSEIPVDGSGSSGPDDVTLTFAWTFTNMPAGSSVAFDDATAQTPIFTPDGPGIYTVELVVSAGDVESDPAFASITATVGPSVFASANVSLGGAPLDVSFSCAVTGGQSPIQYAWDFGDGETVQGQQNPSHQYTDFGTHTARCGVLDANGVAASSSIDIIVEGNSEPEISILNGDFVAYSTTVLFESALTGGNGLINYTWDFGDGETASADAGSDIETLAHTYAANGTYTVSLTVVDADGDTDTDEVSLIVTDDQALSLSITATPMVGRPPLEVTFDATAVGDAPFVYEWDFSDDGVTDNSDEDPIYTYAISGTYTARLTATDDSGDVSVETVTIVVNAAPVADAGDDICAYTSNEVTLNGGDSQDPEGDLFSYSWTLNSAPAESGAVLDDASLASPSFTADLDGDYSFTVVTSDTYHSRADSVTVTASGVIEVLALDPSTRVGDVDATIQPVLDVRVSVVCTESFKAPLPGVAVTWTSAATVPASLGTLTDDGGETTFTAAAFAADAGRGSVTVTSALGGSTTFDLTLLCLDYFDCNATTTGACDDGGTCLDPDCFDDIINQDETDIDCGQTCGTTCLIDEDCVENTDCRSYFCDVDDSDTCLSICDARVPYRWGPWLMSERMIYDQDDSYQESPQDRAAAIGATDQGHTWIMVWESSGFFANYGDTTDINVGEDNDIFIIRSVDNRRTWEGIDYLNPWAEVDTYDWYYGDLDQDDAPDIAGDGSGEWLVVLMTEFTDSSVMNIGSDWDIVYARSDDDGETWVETGVVDSFAGIRNSWDDSDLEEDASELYPQVAYGNGEWLVVWESESVVDDTLDGGTNTGIDWDIMFSIADTGDTAVWTDRALLNETDFSTDNGEVTQPHINDYESAIASDGLGAWVVVWTRNDWSDADSDIFFASYNSGDAEFSSIGPVHSNAATDQDGASSSADRRPAVATDSLGNWLVVWETNTWDATLNVGEETDFDIALTWSDDGATWSTPALIHPSLNLDGNNDDYQPSVATDGEYWLVTWHESGDGADTVWYTYTSDTGEGSTWSTPAPLANYGIDTDIATNGEGRWMVGYQHDRPEGALIGQDFWQYVGFDDDIYSSLFCESVFAPIPTGLADEL